MDNPLGGVRKVNIPLDSSDIAILGQEFEPSSVLAGPASQIDTAEEVQRANPGPIKLIDAPDEIYELVVRKVGNGVRVRGPLDIGSSSSIGSR